MGRPKQLIRFQGKTFVEHCVETLLQSCTNEVIVVTGKESAAVEAAVAHLGVRTIYNPDYKAGMSTTIKTGFRVLSSDTRSVILALVDQPLIRVETINHLLEAHERNGRLITIPTYHERRGHPIVLDATLTVEISAMSDEIGLKQVINAHQNDILYTPVTDEAILLDFDYPIDLEKLPPVETL